MIDCLYVYTESGRYVLCLCRNQQLLLQWDPLHGRIDRSHEGALPDVQVPKQNADMRAQSLPG